MVDKIVKRIVLIASGSGSNVENIINYYNFNPEVKVVMVFTNNPKAGVIDRVSLTKISLKILRKVLTNFRTN